MASKHRLPPPETDQGPAAKRFRPEEPEKLGAVAAVRVELNPADCDLDFNIDGNGLQGHALSEEGFAYCWSGARANVGITRGRYCFGCKIISEQAVDMADTPQDQQHVCRVGISRGDDPVGNLGETTNSFGFGGTGKFSNSGKFSDYGAKYGVGDTIICTVDLENKPLASIGFSKNGKSLGIARHFDASSRGLLVVEVTQQSLPWQSAFFPHVLLKNVMVQLQFSIEDGLVPEEGFRPWAYAHSDGNAVIGPSFASPNTCEVIMMVGLPASGKTTWAEKWIKEHPDKRYVLLGTNLVLDQMKVPGLLRKNNYGERFERLMDRATGIFNTLLARAAKTPRNYILDQTNVYKNARSRKLKAFMNYRKIAVVVFPTPDELRSRAEKRFKEMGKDVPAEAVNEMIANYVLPTTKNMHGSPELFDEVIFSELEREGAQKLLDEMKRALVSSSSVEKRDFPPYPHESSTQSFPSPNFSKMESTSGAGVNWQASRPSLSHPFRDNPSTFQVNTRYYSSGSFENQQIRVGYPDLPTQSDSRYSHYAGPSGSYDGSNFSGRDAYNRSSMPVGGMSSYQTYNNTYAFERSNFDSLSSSEKQYGNQVPPPLFRGPGEHIGDPRRQHGFPPTRAPPYQLQSHVQSTHGSNYGVPPPMPPYGNFSNQVHPPHPPPGQWYH